MTPCRTRKRRRTVLPILTGWLSLAICVAPAAALPHRYALLIASGDFAPGSSYAMANDTLQAPPNDVHLLASLLTWRFGFRPQDIEVMGIPPNSVGRGFVYAERHATAQAIRDGIGRIIAQARPEDYVVVYYSGHGTKVARPGASGNTGPMENALVPYDAPTEFLREDALKHLTRRIHSMHTTLIVDACFSAGLDLLPGANPRQPGDVELADSDGITETETVSKYLEIEPTGQAEPETPDATTDQNDSDSLNDFPDEAISPRLLSKTSRHVFLAACGANEGALAVTLRSADHGTLAISEFTWALYNTLCRNPGDINCAGLNNQVRAFLQQKRATQTPQIEGDTEMLNESVIAPSPFPDTIGIFPTAPANIPELAAGLLAGIHQGMLFTDRTNSLALQVVRSDWFSALVKVNRGRLPLPTLVRQIPSFQATPRH